MHVCVGVERSSFLYVAIEIRFVPCEIHNVCIVQEHLTPPPKNKDPPGSGSKSKKPKARTEAASRVMPVVLGKYCNDHKI